MRLRIGMLTIAVLAAACTGTSQPAPPSTATSEPSTDSTTGADSAATTTTTPARTRDQVIAGTCDVLREARYADRAEAVAAASMEAGAGLRQALATNCADAFTEFATLERLATAAAIVNDNMAVECAAGGSEVLVANNNDFTVDAGILIQVGSQERGLTGGTVVVALGLEAGSSRSLTVDPAEVGTADGSSGCLASVTAWSSETGPTATIFDIDNPLVDPGGRTLPRTRTNDPKTILSEAVRFEVALFDDPDGAYVEEFEDVRSPNFLRLIGDFDERAASGDRVQFGVGDILDVQVIDRPRDDLLLLGWTSTPSSVTFYDRDGTELGTTARGTRVRRGIFLRSPVDGRWRWVHSAFTIIEDSDSPAEDDDAITAGGLRAAAAGTAG